MMTGLPESWRSAQQTNTMSMHAYTGCTRLTSFPPAQSTARSLFRAANSIMAKTSSLLRITVSALVSLLGSAG